jgi:hypothetical protein
MTPWGWWSLFALRTECNRAKFDSKCLSQLKIGAQVHNSVLKSQKEAVWKDKSY